MCVHHMEGNVYHVSNLHSTIGIKVASIRMFLYYYTQWSGTAVYRASAYGHSDVVKLLVQAGADLELQLEVY